jgi:hypothetical protein
MPNLSINFAQLTALAKDAKQAKQVTHDTAWATLRAASLALERGIKQDMPVDTGRARASWGHWTPADIKGAAKGGDDGGPVYDEDEGALNIIQGSNVEYIIYLNAGHSRQAPAGFLEKRALKAQLALGERLGLIDPLSPAAQQIRYVAQFE